MGGGKVGKKKYTEREKALGCLKSFCWSLRALQEEQQHKTESAHTFPAGGQEAPGSKGQGMAAGGGGGGGGGALTPPNTSSA